MQKASINLIKDLKKQKRENRFLLFLDNYKIIKDAIAKGLTPKLLLFCDETLNVWGETYPCYKIDSKALDSLADTKTPQGVLCIAEYSQDIVSKPKSSFLVLDHIQDPGNAGSLIRTATACGFDCVIMVDSVAVTNPKLVRSSVGTIFDIKVFEMTKKEFLAKAKEWKSTLLMADMDGESVFDASFKGDEGLVVGNEGQGVCNEIASLCSKSVKIPMQEGVESLNAAISGSIIMYQMAKDNLS